MAKVFETKYGKVVKATIVTPIEAELPEGDTRTEIPDDEAKGLLNRYLDELAGSNDGSEFLANAKVKLINE